MSREAMKLALEALEAGEYYIDDLEAIVYASDDLGTHEDRAKMQAAIVALREALANEALDKKAENARELGLDYEPVCNKDPQGCWNVRCQLGKKCKNTPAQRTWVGLTDEERKLVRNSVGYNQFVTAGEYAEHVQKATEFKLLEKNNG